MLLSKWHFDSLSANTFNLDQAEILLVDKNLKGAWEWQD